MGLGRKGNNTSKQEFKRREIGENLTHKCSKRHSKDSDDDNDDNDNGNNNKITMKTSK